MKDGIDWQLLRGKIAATPVIVRPKHIKHPNRSEESKEKRKAGARARWKKHYWANREECLELQREWEKANPEKVKAKRKRYYDNHKDDPEFKERKNARNREYKKRKREERKATSLQVSGQLLFQGDDQNIAETQQCPLYLDGNLQHNGNCQQVAANS